MPEATLETKTTNDKLAGKHLTFTLQPESYGIDVLKVREIINLVTITAVPQMPAYVKGVINLRGKIIPVIDLRVKFGMETVGSTIRTCVIVVQVAGVDTASTALGLIVDSVEEVVNIGASEIEDPPDFGVSVDTSYLLGMAKIKGRVVSLLDIDRVLSGEQIQRLAKN